MKNQQIDVFARAWLFLAKAVCENHGADADFKAVPISKDGQDVLEQGIKA